ncbi:TPA: NUDIX domain-containing protein [Candidatus Ventrenecus stercoripullorum]|nr:NUDIX domain-containing protein [Candidatus Ventrenecus stercoripullorum]
MEYLDIYDENGKFLGTEERGVVHSKGLWHKTVHCWLYDRDGNVFFQRRSDRGTLYTTSSGHLSAGESVTEAFQREIKEEIGLDIDASDATKVGVVPFQMDRVKEDGSIFKDRAFANVYVDLYEGNYEDFQMDENEVSGIVIVSAKDALDLFQKESGSILGREISLDNTMIEREISFSEFLVNDGETALEKYGDVLKKIVELTSK